MSNDMGGGQGRDNLRSQNSQFCYKFKTALKIESFMLNYSK